MTTDHLFPYGARIFRIDYNLTTHGLHFDYTYTLLQYYRIHRS